MNLRSNDWCIFVLWGQTGPPILLVYYIFVGSSGIPSAGPPLIYFTFCASSPLVYKPVFYSNSQTTRIIHSTLPKPLFASLGDLAINTALKAINEKFVTLRAYAYHIFLYFIKPSILLNRLKIVTFSRIKWVSVRFIPRDLCYIGLACCEGPRCGRTHWQLLLDDVSALRRRNGSAGDDAWCR